MLYSNTPIINYGIPTPIRKGGPRALPQEMFLNLKPLKLHFELLLGVEICAQN